MEKEKFTKTIGFKYLIDGIFLLALAVTTALLKDLFNKDNVVDVMNVLSDCFTIPGILFILSGLLTWVGSEGGFDMIGYGFVSLKYLFSPSKKTLEKRKSFYEYKQEKEAKGKIWEIHLVISGLIFLVIGIILFIIFKAIA